MVIPSRIVTATSCSQTMSGAASYTLWLNGAQKPWAVEASPPSLDRSSLVPAERAGWRGGTAPGRSDPRRSCPSDQSELAAAARWQ